MSTKKKAPVKKCIVKTCTNYSNGGRFVGQFCTPCWDAITDPGRSGTKHSAIYRQMIIVQHLELGDRELLPDD